MTKNKTKKKTFTNTKKHLQNKDKEIYKDKGHQRNSLNELSLKIVPL